MSYNIGDVVKCNSESNITCLNKKGKIIDTYGQFILVEFFDNVNGHDGFGRSNRGIRGKSGHCWYLRIEDIKLIVKTIKKYGIALFLEGIEKR